MIQVSALPSKARCRGRAIVALEVNRLEEDARIVKTGTLAAQVSRLNIFVLDELGYLPSASDGRFLFRLVNKLYERTSVIITPNLHSAGAVDAEAIPARRHSDRACSSWR